MSAIPLPMALKASKANAWLCARIGVTIDGQDMGKRVVAYDAAIGWASLTDGSTRRGVVQPYWRDEAEKLVVDARPAFDQIMRVYLGSNGDATKALYQRLDALGPVGFVASNLFRACKCSERAKDYRRGSQKREAYRRKQWALDNLDAALGEHGAAIGLTWGWAQDPAQEFHNQVLYVELPTGQVSFHTDSRGKGPDFAGVWDGVRGEGPERICRWVVMVLEAEKGEG